MGLGLGLGLWYRVRGRIRVILTGRTDLKLFSRPGSQILYPVRLDIRVMVGSTLQTILFQHLFHRRTPQLH